nr:hypothetical protein [Tanacetum cinerariifolium]
MTTLADKAILSGADNRPPMLEKDMYDSWKSRMELYMMNRKHGRMILESIENCPLLWPTIEENRVTQPKKYSKVSATKAIQADCDVKATNIILQGLPPEVYALVSNNKVVKELWEIIQLLMQGTSLMKHERECKLYDEFDKFAYKKGESLSEFYLRFSLLLNDMNIYNMKLEQFQVNTKFLNTLPPEWSKFVTDVKLKGDDPIDAINHMMSFLTVVVISRVTVQPIQGRHNSLAAGTSRTYTSRANGNNSGKQRIVVCYNCKGKGHMSKQCTKPKRKRDESWFKDKNPNHPNDPNVPEGEQAPAVPNGFTPQWIGEHDLNNNNRWIEWDVPLGGELDKPMVDPKVNEEVMDDEDWDDDAEWLMAPVTPPRATMTVSSTYVVGGPSTVAVKGPSSPLPTPGLPVPPTVIEDFSTRLGNLEYRHRVLMRKMEEVSDAEVADSIAIGEIHPRVATVREQVQVMESQAGQVVCRLKEIETRVQQVESRVNTHPNGQMAVEGQDVIFGSSQQVHTLQTALHETELQNPQLRTRVTEMESHVGILMSYMLWMEDRLTNLEKRLPGPPPGP